jgi:hypothetical protein
MKATFREDVTETQIKYGGGNDPRGLLLPGHTYEVAKKEVHRWHTRIFLVGIDGWFNSVMFDLSEDENAST